jgi:hypothetical protein
VLQIDHHPSMPFYGTSLCNITYFLVLIFLHVHVCGFAVEDLLLHDIYVLVAFVEQESDSERLKQVGFLKNFCYR